MVVVRRCVLVARRRLADCFALVVARWSPLLKVLLSPSDKGKIQQRQRRPRGSGQANEGNRGESNHYRDMLPFQSSQTWARSSRTSVRRERQQLDMRAPLLTRSDTNYGLEVSKCRRCPWTRQCTLTRERGGLAASFIRALLNSEERGPGARPNRAHCLLHMRARELCCVAPARIPKSPTVEARPHALRCIHTEETTTCVAQALSRRSASVRALNVCARP